MKAAFKKESYGLKNTKGVHKTYFGLEVAKSFHEFHLAYLTLNICALLGTQTQECSATFHF